MITRLPPIDQKIYNLPVEKQVRELGDYLMRYRRESEFLLNGNIDSTNVRSITTDQLIAGSARIKTAMIESLEVGRNVIMGPDATISWGKVNNKPTDIVYQAALASYVTNGALSSALLSYVTDTKLTTKLGEDYIITGKILANRIVGGTISGVNIDVNTDLKVGNNITIGDSPAYDKSIIFYGIGSVSALGDTISIEGNLGAWVQNVYFGKYNVDFSNVSVSGLNYASINHNHGNDYVKSYTGQNLSLVATETGLAVRVNGVTLGSIFYD